MLGFLEIRIRTRGRTCFGRAAAVPDRVAPFVRHFSDIFECGCALIRREDRVEQKISKPEQKIRTRRGREDFKASSPQ